MTPPTRVGRVVCLVVVCSAVMVLPARHSGAEVCSGVTPVLEVKPPVSGYAGAPYTLTVGPEKLAACTNLSYWLDFGSGNTCSAASWSTYYLSQTCTYTTAGGPYRWTAKVSADGGKTVLWSESGDITISDPAVDCKSPQLVVTASPPATATSRAYYPLTIGPSKVSSCSGFEYWLDFGIQATAQCPQAGWTGSRDRTCPYPAPGTYTWTAKARGPGIPEFSRSGTTTVYDCTITCDGQVPASGQIGVPVTFAWIATPSHCTPRWWVRHGWTVSPTGGVDDSCATEPCTFTFSTPGTYDWNLVTQARWGGPALYKECFDSGKITIAGAAELKVGNLTFKGASLTQNGTTYTLAGPVRVNEVLRFPGQVVFTGNPASGKGELSTNADAQVATTPATTTILSGSSQVGYSVDGTTSPGRLTPRLLPGLAALDFSLDGVPLYLLPGEPIGVTASGVQLFATLFVGTADFHLATLRLQLGLSPGQPVALLSGGNTVVNGDGLPGVRVESISSLTYDPATKHLAGKVMVDFPLIEARRASTRVSIPLALSVENGCINSLEANPEDLVAVSVYLGAGWRPFLWLGGQGSGLAISEICRPEQYAPLFQGTLYFHTSQASGFLVESSMWAYEPPGALTLLWGQPWFLGRPVLDARARVFGLGGFDVLFLRGGFGTGGLPGGKDVLWGTLRSATVSWRQTDPRPEWGTRGDLTGAFTFHDTCACPDDAGEDCRVARVALKGLAPGRSTRFELTASGPASTGGYTSRFQGRGAFPDKPEVDVRVVRFDTPDGKVFVSCWLGCNLAGRPTTKPASLLGVQATIVERSLSFAKTETLAIFGVRGKSSALPTIYLRNPAGQKITPATVGSFPTVTYASDAAAKLALFTVTNAAAGIWTLGEDNLPESDVDFTVLAPLPLPVTTFNQVQASGTSTSIVASVTPASTSTKVALFFSRIHDGLPEGTIAADLPATSGSVAATWDTTPLPSGTYYLFAVTDDGRNAPVTTYHATPITIDTGGLAPPTNLQAVRSGETVTLTWTPSTSTAVVGYTVMYTDQPDQPGYTGSAPALRPNGATVVNLGYSRSYRFCVVGYDLGGNTSPFSTSVTVPPGRGRARRNFGD